jgi:large subunit ribosomal protein L37Ae
MRNVRYGARLRKLVDAAITSKNQKYECPKCGKRNVRRNGNSRWECRSCKTVFAGGAYSFSTGVGEVANRMIREYEK